MKQNIMERKNLVKIYDLAIADLPLSRPVIPDSLDYNYAYYPVLFQNEEELLKAVTALKSKEIVPRRYFWPSLESLPYLNALPCTNSSDISSRILCLPFYNGLSREDQQKVINVLHTLY